MIAKKYRIKREKIPYILKKGSELKSKLFIIRYVYNQESTSRFRTIVSKKVARKAVDRNKINRRIYNAINPFTKQTTTEPHFDIILIPRKFITQANFSEIEADIANIINKQIVNHHNGKSQ